MEDPKILVVGDGLDAIRALAAQHNVQLVEAPTPELYSAAASRAAVLEEIQNQARDARRMITGEKLKPYVRTEPKIGRNEKCPCDSGKKFKHCHGSRVN